MITATKRNVVHSQIITAAAAIDDAQQTLPAYPGARFNSSGFCMNHSNVRLCTVTDEGKYKILRKTCFKCGSSSLRNNSYTLVNTLHGHGNAKKDIPSRELPKGLFSATASSSDGGSGSGAKDQQSSTSRMRGDHNSKAKKPLPSSEVLRRKKARDSTTKTKGVISTGKDRNSRSTEPATATTTTTTAKPPQLGPTKPEGSTRRSLSRSLSTSRTMTSLSLSELSELYPPPPGRPTEGRSRSKSRTRKNTSIDKYDIKHNNKKAVRSAPIINMSSSKSVEAKVKEITKSKATLGKVDYAELGKLITMKDDENTLPTLSCPSTPESFKSKEAVFSFDKKSGLIVELYNKKESAETARSSNRREDMLQRVSKLKQHRSTRTAT